MVNELRIGNWIKILRGKKIDGELKEFYTSEQVREISIDPLLEHKLMKYIHNSPYFINGQQIEKILPIELNDDILLRSGFEKIDSNIWLHTSSGIPLEKGSMYKWGHKDKLGYYPITLVLYLHQLQNLFFALTEKELTYKP